VVVSLVNDMLRDLETKRGIGATENGALSNAGDRVLQSGVPRTPARRTLLPAAVAFVVVTVAVLWQQQSDQLQIDEQQQQVATPAVENLPPRNDSVTAALVHSGSETDTESEPGPAQGEPLPAMTPVLNYYVPPDKQLEAASADQQQLDAVDRAQIETLLQTARRALKRDRLTAPIDDNAYSRFQQVLALEPGNVEARQGLDIIAERYLRLAQEYASEGNIVRAKVLLRRAAVVNPASPQLLAFERTLAQTPVAPVAAVNSTVISSVPATPQSTPETATSPKALSVSKSAQWRDNDKVRQVRGLIDKGDHTSAKLQLQAFLAAFPQAPESTKILFHLYLQLGEIQRAKGLLEQADFLPAPTQAALTAHLFLAQDDVTAALQVLESQPQVYRQQVDFLSMLAGVYHKAGRYRDSASSYQQLLRQDGDRPAYWLGLAVALDALQDRPKALAAFKQAQQGRQSQAVTRYIAERIRALSS